MSWHRRLLPHADGLLSRLLPWKPRFGRDVHFVSFAKSGRTWVRLFLNHYYFQLYPLSVTARHLRKYDEGIPRIHYSHGQHYAKHARAIVAEARALRRSCVIFMMRDPRDVVVSYYLQRTRRHLLSARHSPLDWQTVSLSQMMRHPIFGLPRIVEYMNLWDAALPACRRSLVLQYEQLHADTSGEFARLIEFLDHQPPQEAALQKALNETTFSAMQDWESTGRCQEQELARGRSDDQESSKVRRGKIGGYVDYFSPEDLVYAHGALEGLRPELRSRFPDAAAPASVAGAAPNGVSSCGSRRDQAA